MQLNIIKLDAEKVAKQIVAMNADLYRQLKISEIIDLRFQKDENYSASLHKVHDFSNKVT